MDIKFQFRRGTESEWTSANPILLSGEIGIETDTKDFKFGDGTTEWNDLPYAIRRDIANEQDGDYSLVLTDNGKTIYCTDDVPHTITIPTNGDVPFKIGTTVAIAQEGEGLVTILADTGVTLNGVVENFGDITQRYGMVMLIKRGTNIWDAFGAITVMSLSPSPS